MNDFVDFQKRIGWQGDVKLLLLKVCNDYQIGKYRGHEIIPLGYEDFNLVLATDKGTFFVKVFGDFRDVKNCKRYIEIMERVIDAGVKHPALYESPQGYLYQTEFDSVPIRLCLMRYIDGKSLYDLRTKVKLSGVSFFAKQAALINQINFLPEKVYDSWAIVNFPEEYAKKKHYLDEEDKKLIKPLAQTFSLLRIADLPHCFVHGDILKTNVLRDRSGNLFVVDFSVANTQPRIQELAVLLCNVLFDEDDPASFKDYYDLTLSEYQKLHPARAQRTFRNASLRPSGTRNACDRRDVSKNCSRKQYP